MYYSYPFLDISFGVNPYWANPRYLANIALGYTFTPELAIGVSRRVLSECTELKGWGIEGRYMPNEKLQHVFDILKILRGAF